MISSVVILLMFGFSGQAALELTDKLAARGGVAHGCPFDLRAAQNTV